MLAAEAIGPFAFVFAGCSGIMAVATDTRAVGEAAAIAIGGTVGLAALFGGPISGASMNPARSLGPALVSGNTEALWLYLTAPLLGAALGGAAYQLVRGDQPSPAEIAAHEMEVAAHDMQVGGP